MEPERFILHIDGDAFFASCEQAADPRLKGGPVVTGYERGMAVAVSYEAKALGVRRGDPVFQIRKQHPECIIVPSHYELYERFSRRMLDIVERYTTSIEAYSIDECFADLSDSHLLHKLSPRAIAWHIKLDIERELGLSFSFGIARTKTLAKIASTKNKPKGFICFNKNNYHTLLQQTSISDVWGIGRATSIRLRTYGVETAFEFTQKDRCWVEQSLAKPYVTVWNELRGKSVIPLITERKVLFDSISKTRTFRPPTSDPNILFAQLSKNIEGACKKARAYNLTSCTAEIFIKTQQFKYAALTIRIATPTNIPTPFIKAARTAFVRLYKRGELYRATGCTLTHLQSKILQKSLFEERVSQLSMERVIETVDQLSHRYGPHVLYLASSARAMSDKKERNIDSAHSTTLLIPVVSNVARRIYVPMSGSI